MGRKNRTTTSQIILDGVLCAALVATSCVAPSITEEDFREDAANSAQEMISVAEAALLTVRVSEAGAAPAAYVTLRLWESESDANAIITAFSSVQPPSAKSDRLRAMILERLQHIATVIEDLRINAERGAFHRLPARSRPLGPAMANVRSFLARV